MNEKKPSLNDVPQNSGRILPDEINNEQSSFLYVKKLVALSISNIAYLRGLFQDTDYADRSFEDINIKVIKNDKPELKCLSNWLFGCYDALDKRYLKTMIFALYDDLNNPDKVLETYEFGFTYTDANVSLTFSINDSKRITYAARKNAIRILRGIFNDTQKLKELPDNVYMNMKLTYYDDVTPVDYEPPCFKAAQNSEFFFDGKKVALTEGKLNGHWLKLKFNMNVSEKVIMDIDEYEFDILNNKHANDQTTISEPIDDIKKRTINCPCQLNDDFELGMIQCKICNTWQHAICFKIFNNDDFNINNKHHCHVHPLDKLAINDDNSFTHLSEDDARRLALSRRVLNEFLINKELNLNDLNAKFDLFDVGKVVKDLTNEGILICKNQKKKIYSIADMNLTKSKYFKGSINTQEQHVPVEEPMEINDDIDQLQKREEEKDSKIQKSKPKAHKTSQVIQAKNKTIKASEGFQKSPKALNKFKMSFE